MHYPLLIECEANEEKIGKLMFPFLEWGSANEEDSAALEALGVVQKYQEDDVEYRRNIQGKWGWWVIGGRWAGAGPGGLTTFQKSRISLDDFRNRLAVWAAEYWDNVERLLRKYTNATAEQLFVMDKENRRFVVKQLNENASGDDRGALMSFYDGELRGATREEHIKNSSERPPTFAFLTSDGKWIEKETYVPDQGFIKNENFYQDFCSWYESLPDDAWLTFVDYHN
jgi:hypothetical protein